MANYKSIYTGEEIDAGIAKANTAIQDVSNKVDKIEGKGLSANDYTTEEKTKLANIDMSSKQDKLVSGTNIKTINNIPILGSGNIETQEKLISEVNLKTINHQSLLGSGNITVEGGSGTGIDFKNFSFEGKTASFYGDSLTERNSHYTKGYHSWLQELLGLSTFNNYGHSGHTTQDCYSNVNGITDTADIIFVMIGVNDATRNVPLGQWGDKTLGTTYGNYYMLFSLLKNKYPTKPIIIITPHIQTKYPTSGKTAAEKEQWMYDIGEACRKTAVRFSLPLFDSAVENAIFSSNLSVYTTDNCHWNDKGHELVGRNLASWCYRHCNYFYGGSSKTLSSITASFNPGSHTVYTTDTLESLKPYIVVNAKYSDNSTQTVTAYELTGSLANATNTITIKYSGKTTTITVNATVPATVTGLVATSTQGSQVIYDTATLGALKNYITVQAQYSDGTQLNITNYSISGDIAVGTQTYTISYNGFTTTVDLLITAAPVLDSISAVYDSGSTIIYTNNTLDDLTHYLTVTAVYDNETSMTVENYTLSGDISAAGTQIITVSYTEKDITKTTTFEVEVELYIQPVNPYVGKIYTINSMLNDKVSHLKPTFAKQTEGTWQVQYDLEVLEGNLMTKSSDAGGLFFYNTIHTGTGTGAYDGIGTSTDPRTITETSTGKYTAKIGNTSRNYSYPYFADIIAVYPTVGTRFKLTRCELVRTDIEADPIYPEAVTLFFDTESWTIEDDTLLESIGAVFTPGDHYFFEGESTLDDLKPYLSVDATLSTGVIEPVDASKYILSGSMTAGAQTITVTYDRCGITKTTTFTVTVYEQRTVESIEATFEPGTAIISQNTDLLALKNYLTVMATYNDGETVSLAKEEYTLSGVLVVNEECTITVTYTHGATVTDVFTVTPIESTYKPLCGSYTVTKKFDDTLGIHMMTAINTQTLGSTDKLKLSLVFQNPATTTPTIGSGKGVFTADSWEPGSFTSTGTGSSMEIIDKWVDNGDGTYKMTLQWTKQDAPYNKPYFQINMKPTISFDLVDYELYINGESGHEDLIEYIGVFFSTEKEDITIIPFN